MDKKICELKLDEITEVVGGVYTATVSATSTMSATSITPTSTLAVSSTLFKSPSTLFKFSF